MIKKSCGFLAAVLLLGMTSCNDDNPWMGKEGHGSINLSLTADGRVKDVIPQTRAEDLFEIPSVEDFNIKIERSDGNFSRTYTYNDFLKENSFPTGKYTLTAYAGDPQQEGFDCPYFEGQADVTVLEERESEVSIQAKVSNSLISLNYTDAFKKYMKSYSSTLHSAGGSYIEVPADIAKPAFITPGDVALSLTFTNQQNQELTIQPAQFTAEAGHHYHITLNVNGGEVGDATLEVIFDDSINEESVYIDLTDELFTDPAPKVNLTGFNVAEGEVPEIEFLAGEAPEGQYRFTVISYAGLNSVMFTLKGYESSVFGSEVNLINASQAVQDELASLGIDCRGLFKNPDKMAYIDISNLPNNLPPGQYEVSVLAKDKLTRTSEVATVKLNSVAPTVKVTPYSAVYGTNQGSLVVNYNGSNPAKDVSFKAMNQNGVYVDAPVTSWKEKVRTRAFEGKDYLFTIKLQDMEQDVVKVQVFLYGQYVETVDLEVEMPEYTVQADPFAKRVMIKVNSDEDQKAVITQCLRVYNSGSQISESKISRDTENGVLTVTGLNASQTYNLAVSLRSATKDARNLSFTTEAAADVSNGGFDNTEETINIVNINNGGEYKAGVHSRCFNTTDIVVSEPRGWASLNQLTCYQGSSTKNTWFMVPSTYMEDGAVKVRSVAYSHNGVVPAYKDYGIFNYTWYSQNTPASIDSRTSGELFLGSYSYNGNASRTNGVAFGSRPSSVSFSYAYESYDNEVGEVYVAVLDQSGNVIATATRDLTSASAMTNVTVELPQYQFGTKASSLQIRFRSTKGTSISTRMPSGTALNDTAFQDNSIGGLGVTPPSNSGFHIQANMYNAKSTGSELTVDNVKINY